MEMYSLLGIKRFSRQKKRLKDYIDGIQRSLYVIWDIEVWYVLCFYLDFPKETISVVFPEIRKLLIDKGHRLSPDHKNYLKYHYGAELLDFLPAIVL